MLNSVKGIHKWNHDSKLSSNNDRWLESYMLLEEIYEGMGIPKPKEEARAFIAIARKREDLIEVPEVEWLDHLCDLEFILHGSKCKMGLSPQEDSKSIQVVLLANNQKLNAGKDSHGKQLKPEGFVGPEAALQKILDSNE